MFGPQCDLGAKCVFSGQPCVREIASFLRVEYWSVIGPAGMSVSSLSFPIRVVHHSHVALCIRQGHRRALPWNTAVEKWAS